MTNPQYLTCDPLIVPETPYTVRVSYDFEAAELTDPVEVTAVVQLGNTEMEFVIYPPPGDGYHDFIVPAGAISVTFVDKGGLSADAAVLVA